MFGIICVEEDKICLLTEIYARQEPTEIQYRQILDWISGQLSDGWGEGLEQREVLEEKIRFNKPLFDEDTCEFEEEEICSTAYYYVHPWSSNRNWSLDLVSNETVDLYIPGEEPVVYEAVCKLMENGGYEVRTVYQMNSVEDVINCVKNSPAFFSDEFVQWIENHGTFGCAVRFYVICINEGYFTKFLPTLGILDMDTQRCRIFTIEAEDGSINLDEYMEEEQMDFYKDLLSK